MMTNGENFDLHNFCLIYTCKDIIISAIHTFCILTILLYIPILILAQFIVHIENKAIAFQSAYANNVWIGTQDVNGDVVLVS